MPIRVLLADEQKLYLHGIRALLNGKPDIVVVGEVCDSKDLLATVHNSNPDVLCMAVSKPVSSPTTAIRNLLELNPSIRIIALSDLTEWPFIHAIVNAGASAYISKAAHPKEFVQTIRAVIKSERRLFCQHITECILDTVLSEGIKESRSAQLTPREQEILKLIAQGRTSQEIAKLLKLSLPTVRGYRANIMRNLNLHNSSDLTRYALRAGMISTNP